MRATPQHSASLAAAIVAAIAFGSSEPLRVRRLTVTHPSGEREHVTSVRYNGARLVLRGFLALL